MSDHQKKDELRPYSFNTALMAVIGKVGCLTVVLTLAAFALGFLIDNQFGTTPLLMILFVVGSVPLNLVLIFKMTQKTTSRLEDPTKKKQETPDQGGTL